MAEPMLIRILTYVLHNPAKQCSLQPQDPRKLTIFNLILYTAVSLQSFGDFGLEDDLIRHGLRSRWDLGDNYNINRLQQSQNSLLN